MEFQDPKFMATPAELSKTRRPDYMHMPQTTPYLLGARIRRELPSIDRVPKPMGTFKALSVFPPLEESLGRPMTVARELQGRDVWWLEPPTVFSKYMENIPRSAISTSAWAHTHSSGSRGL